MPRFTVSLGLPGLMSLPRKKALCAINLNHAPIYRAPRFTGNNLVLQSGPVNRVLLSYQYHYVGTPQSFQEVLI